MNTINTLLLSFSISVFMIGCSGEGTDNAQLEADISPVIPKIYSTVTEIRVNDNELVKAGDTLVILDDATFRIAVEQAEIGLLQALRNVKVAGINTASANVNVSNMTANSYAVSATMSSATAAIEAAKARLAVADKNYERYSQLLQQKSTTQQQFDQVKADKADADAKLQAAIGQRDALVKQIDASKLQVENTRTQVSGTQENIGLAELAVKEARTKLEAAKLQLSYCTIVAPVNGIVSKKNVQIGQVVATGTPLMAIANNKKFWVMANFKETQTQKMRTGQKVDIEVDAYPDTTFTGKVESLSQATGARFSFLPADNATGNFVKVTQRIPVKITMADNESPNYQLRAGMSVYVKVKTN
ncbi:membrane fusion protein, multidrug efflux system [Chitinophaga sp. YR573]|uniref:HlyD family secretion protein n=1 Tax=Chitinophaga sp. YR573 TaxID=1881040 RepID=UPI0008D37AEF|nr:HlyD family secretion protein [Chitinophaga sp. YR573]SEV88015.1 membrane fusion protein, multidrug efflux system [Chitinophaga sp. YR573]